MENKPPCAAERNQYREYLKENSRIVSEWPDWMKDGAHSTRDSYIPEAADTNVEKNCTGRSATGAETD